jgi:hypothetical protein
MSLEFVKLPVHVLLCTPSASNWSSTNSSVIAAIRNCLFSGTPTHDGILVCLNCCAIALFNQFMNFKRERAFNFTCIRGLVNL